MLGEESFGAVTHPVRESWEGKENMVVSEVSSAGVGKTANQVEPLLQEGATAAG